MAEKWNTERGMIALIQSLYDIRPGHAQRIWQDARGSREISRRRKGGEPVLLLPDDGITGMDLRPGAQNVGGAVEHEWNEGDLLDRLRRHPPEVANLATPPPNWSKPPINPAEPAIADKSDVATEPAATSDGSPRDAEIARRLRKGERPGSNITWKQFCDGVRENADGGTCDRPNWGFSDKQIRRAVSRQSKLK
jgi:hypothetical protein